MDVLEGLRSSDLRAEHVVLQGKNFTDSHESVRGLCSGSGSRVTK